MNNDLLVKKCCMSHLSGWRRIQAQNQVTKVGMKLVGDCRENRYCGHMLSAFLEITWFSKAKFLTAKFIDLIRITLRQVTPGVPKNISWLR